MHIKFSPIIILTTVDSRRYEFQTKNDDDDDNERHYYWRLMMMTLASFLIIFPNQLMMSPQTMYQGRYGNSGGKGKGGTAF